MKDWKLRVVEEKKELDEKIAKLSAFIEQEQFNVIDADEKQRLIRQEQYMVEYSLIFAERIANFE